MSPQPSLAGVSQPCACCAPTDPSRAQPAPKTAAPALGAAPRSGSTRSFGAALGQALATSSPARDDRQGYPHLSGDLDSNPVLLARLERLAAERGENWTITSGTRTFAEQQRLWDNRAANGFPVARPGSSSHESGNAADVTIGGRPIQDVIGRAELVAAGLAPLAGDAVHIDLPSSS